MIRINGIRISLDEDESLLKTKAAKLLRINEKYIEKLTIFKKSVDARKKDDIHFSYDQKKILAHSHRYTPTRTKIDTMLVTEAPYMFDMLGATMYLRSLDWNKMKSGESFPFQVAIGRERINISFRYTGQQIVERSETLKYRTRHFYIDIYDDAFTQSKEAAEIWIGDDENHIPIKIRAKLKIGAAEVYYKSSKGLRYPLTSRVEIKRR